MTTVERFHPGEYLRDELQERGIDPIELSKALEYPRGYIRYLVEEKAPMTPEIAIRLEALGIGTAVVWWGLQRAHEGKPNLPGVPGDLPVCPPPAPLSQSNER